MSDENFIARWSRRKRAADEEADTNPRELTAAETNAPAEPEKPFDTAVLPPVESLGPGSDIRAFLQKNVPADLTRAALRRAWSTDPAIRDFIGLSENAWDFNAPHTIPGFGTIEMTDELRRMVAEIVGDKTDAAVPSPREPSQQSADVSSQETVASESREACEPSVSEVKEPSSVDDENAASQQKTHAAPQQAPSPAEPRRLTRGHGGALPH